MGVAFHIVAATAVGCALWQFVFGEGKYSGWNYDRITTGLTLHDVERLLGSRREELQKDQAPLSMFTVREPSRVFRWRSVYGHGEIIIALDNEGRVCGKDMFEPSW